MSCLIYWINEVYCTVFFIGPSSPQRKKVEVSLKIVICMCWNLIISLSCGTLLLKLLVHSWSVHSCYFFLAFLPLSWACAFEPVIFWLIFFPCLLSLDQIDQSDIYPRSTTKLLVYRVCRALTRSILSDIYPRSTSITPCVLSVQGLDQMAFSYLILSKTSRTSSCPSLSCWGDQPK